MELSNLAADLRPDRACSAGHHDNFSLNALPKNLLVQAHRLTAQQVLYSDIPYLLAQLRIVNKFPQTWHHFVFHLGIENTPQNAYHLLSRRGRDCNEDFLDIVLPHQCPEILRSEERRVG